MKIVTAMSIELILNAANLVLVTIDLVRNVLDGQLFALMLIGVAAAEVAVGLALILRLCQRLGTLDADAADRMRG